MNLSFFIQPIVALFFILFSTTYAQVGPVDPVGFSFIGRIDAMALNTGNNPLRGGTITVNSVKIIVPDNLLATLPSITVAWEELFKADGTPNLPMFGTQSWSVTIFGNVFGDKYIAGLIYIAQDQTQVLQGYISSIDTATGHITIGANKGAPANTGFKAVLNDPTGVYGKAYTDNPLWSVDPQNPSIRSSTGFPVCIPRSANDPLCPASNRPKDANGKPLTKFTFKDPAKLAKGDPDPHVMVPLVVGDYITFSATDVGNDLYAIYSLVANIAIFTAPKTKPAYVTVDALNYAIVDTQGGEIAETRAVVFTTDPTTTIDWFAMDVNPCSGDVTERHLLLALPFTGPPAGRTIFRLGTTDASPPPRNVVFRATTGTTQGPQGIIAGQFVQPVFNYIFPELIQTGGPMLHNSFDTIPYLAQGGGPFAPGNLLTPPLVNPPIVRQLNPWPGPGAPTKAKCPGAPPEPPVSQPAAAPAAPAPAPPATNPPATNPPATNPPATNPPATNPPATNPPATNPPATNPPATNPPATNPPATNPPATNPPATNPPATNPPATNPPATNPPAPAPAPPAPAPPAPAPPAPAPPAPAPPARALPVTDTVTIVSVVRGVARGGIVPLSITAKSSDTTGKAKLFASVSGITPIRAEPMINNGGGNYFLKVSVRGPRTVTVNSSEGGTASKAA